MCCDDAYLVMPRDSALAGYDRLVSEPLVIENYSISDLEKEPIEEEPLEEPKEEGQLEESKKEADSDLLLDARSRPGLAESGKANVVADALSRKERVNPRQVRAMPMTIQSNIKDKLLSN
ncbi:hypothetical protein Tco_0299944 [Tanacetum coccineum]